MDEKIVYYSIAFLLLVASALAVYKTFKEDPFSSIQKTFDPDQVNTTTSSPPQRKQGSLYTMTIDDTEIQVEIADDASERAQGLSGRDPLPENTGMLFLYDNEILPAFWMYNMKFDLDIIWIRDSVVVDISENVPAPEPDTPRTELPRYYPSTSVDSILEVNAGYVQEHDIRIGDSVILPELSDQK